MLAGRLVFAVIWQMLPSVRGAGTLLTAERAALGGAGWEASLGGFMQSSACSQEPGPETRPSSELPQTQGSGPRSLGRRLEMESPSSLKEEPEGLSSVS